VPPFRLLNGGAVALKIIKLSTGSSVATRFQLDFNETSSNLNIQIKSEMNDVFVMQRTRGSSINHTALLNYRGARQ
jgi:hypothetical protein